MLFGRSRRTLTSIGSPLTQVKCLPAYRSPAGRRRRKPGLLKFPASYSDTVLWRVEWGSVVSLDMHKLCAATVTVGVDENACSSGILSQRFELFTEVRIAGDEFAVRLALATTWRTELLEGIDAAAQFSEDHLRGRRPFRRWPLPRRTGSRCGGRSVCGAVRNVA